MTGIPSNKSSFFLSLATIFIFDFAVFLPFLFISNGDTIGAENGDLAFFFKPMREYAVARLNEGRFPFWNPYTSGGRPFFADPEMSLFYPLTYLFMRLRIHLAFSWSYFIHYVIAGWGMVFLCKGLNISRSGSAVSALIYTWSAPHLLHMYAGHFTMIQTFAWTPWVIWSLDGFLVTLAWRYAALLGLFLGLHLLGGFPLYTYMVGWTLLAYGIFMVANSNLWSRYKVICFRLGVGLLLGAGLFLTQAFTTYELVQHSTRDKNDFSFSASYSLKKENIVTVFVPYYFGESSDIFPDESSYYGPTFIWENSAYMGIAGLIMGLVGCGRWREAKTFFWMAIFLIGFSISLGHLTPLFEYCYEWLPGFSMFRGYSKALSLASLAMAILAGMGLDLVKMKPNDYWVRYIIFGVSILLLILSFISFISPEIFPFWKRLLNQKYEGLRILQDLDLEKACYFVLQKSLLTSSLIALLISTVIFCFPKKVSSAALGTIIFILTAGDFYLFSLPYMQGMDLKSYSIPEKFFSSLRSRANPGRIFWGDPLIANLSLPNQVYSVGGYENFPLREYSKLVNHLNGESLTNKNPYLMVNANHSTMKFFGGNFVATSHNPHPPPGFKRLKVVQVARIPYVLYQSPIDWPRYYIVHSIRPINAERVTDYFFPERYKQEAERVMSDFQLAIHLAPKIYANASRQKVLRSKRNSRETITLFEESPGHAALRVQMEAPGFLVVNENYYPGWNAKVDNTKSTVFPANLTMKAVFVPEGNHEIEFYFIPSKFWVLLTVSLASMAGLIFLIKFNPKPFRNLDDSPIL